jgi:hypothetical protein
MTLEKHCILPSQDSYMFYMTVAANSAVSPTPPAHFFYIDLIRSSGFGEVVTTSVNVIFAIHFR